MHFRPSIITHTLHGILAIVAIVLLFVFSNKLQTLDAYRILVLILLFSATIGIHGISHLGLEREYGYSPYAWFVEPFPPQRMECPCMAAMKKMAAEKE